MAIMFGAAVILPDRKLDAFVLLMSILSFIGLYFYKVEVLIFVTSDGLVGLAKYFIFG